MRLEISTTPALIGMQTQKPQLEIEQDHNTLDIQTEHVKLEMQSTKPKVTIDQTESFNDAGLKTISALMQEMVSISRSNWLQGIARKAEQGDDLADIPNGFGAIASQASYNAFNLFDKEFNIGTVPRSRPQIDVIEGTLDIQARRGAVQNNTQKSNPRYNYTRGKLDIYLRQQNSITIEAVEDEFDMKI